jgi:gamma-glutamyl-gamma-aminobutyrate hydrolase PuuD
MYTKKMAMSTNFAIDLYRQLLTLSIPLIGICAGAAGIQLSYNSYMAAEKTVVSQSSQMVNNVINLVTKNKEFDYTPQG